MPSLSAAACALPWSREAMARTSEWADRMIAGVTFSMPILAVDNMPHRTFLAIASPLKSDPPALCFRRRSSPVLIDAFDAEGNIAPSARLVFLQAFGGADKARHWTADSLCWIQRAQPVVKENVPSISVCP